MKMDVFSFPKLELAITTECNELRHNCYKYVGDGGENSGDTRKL